MQCVGYGDDIDNNIAIALLLALAMGNRCCPVWWYPVPPALHQLLC